LKSRQAYIVPVPLSREARVLTLEHHDLNQTTGDLGARPRCLQPGNKQPLELGETFAAPSEARLCAFLMKDERKEGAQRIGWNNVSLVVDVAIIISVAISLHREMFGFQKAKTRFARSPVHAPHNLQVLLRELERCPLHAPLVAWRHAHCEAKVDEDEMPLEIYHDVPVVPVLQPDQIAAQRVANEAVPDLSGLVDFIY